MAMAVREISSQLREKSGDQLFGLLRHVICSDEIDGNWRGHNVSPELTWLQPQIVFNYFGRMDEAGEDMPWNFLYDEDIDRMWSAPENR